MDALERHPWKRNVRKLENNVERLLILGESDDIRVADLPERVTPAIRGCARPGRRRVLLHVPAEGRGLEEPKRP